jgi:hypothetical protein
MVDDLRASEWEREARVAQARFYGTDNLAGHFAAITLALLRDRQDLLSYLNRVTADRQ